MNLYRKHRPTSLSEIVGNAETTDILESKFKTPEKIPHQILIVGPSGSGKTTLARLVASALECSKHDLYEINMADARGIDTAREIIAKSVFKPMSGRVKVFINDEIQGATKDFFDAILKVTEDTPRHAYFIFCTTNPSKIPAALKNRCTILTTQSLDENQIKSVMGRVIKLEKAKIPSQVLDQIAQDCMGSSRAALVILEKIMDLPEAKMLAAAKQAAEQQTEAINLCRALMANKPWKEVAVILKTLTDEPESVRRMVLGYFNSVLLNSGQARAAEIMGNFADHYYDSGKAGLTLSCFISCKR